MRDWLCDVRLGAINQGWHRGQGEGDMHVGSGARSEPERKIAKSRHCKDYVQRRRYPDRDAVHT